MTLTSYDLCGPNPNPMTRAEVDGLKLLAKNLPPNPVIINIGAERGTSTLAMLEERPDAMIYSVDIGECPGEFNNLKAAGLDSSRVLRVLGRSQEVGLTWKIMADMIFVDGDHSEAGVEGDILAWKDKLWMDGILAFHDYIPEPIPPEIKGRVIYAVARLIEGDNPIMNFEEILWIERLKAFRLTSPQSHTVGMSA